MNDKPSPAAVERCAECGFEYVLTADELPDALRSLGRRFESFLVTAASAPSGDAALRRRPEPQVWSALGYACHVRDLMFVQRERLYQVLVEDDPSFSPMYRDDRAVLAGYDDEDPGRVAAEIVMATSLLGRAFSRLDGLQWNRRCQYNFPVVAQRSVLWMGQHTMHEGEHHLRDAERVLTSPP